MHYMKIYLSIASHQ